jgi:hypothetical protein
MFNVFEMWQMNGADRGGDDGPREYGSEDRPGDDHLTAASIRCEMPEDAFMIELLADEHLAHDHESWQ